MFDPAMGATRNLSRTSVVASVHISPHWTFFKFSTGRLEYRFFQPGLGRSKEGPAEHPFASSFQICYRGCRVPLTPCTHSHTGAALPPGGADECLARASRSRGPLCTRGGRNIWEAQFMNRDTLVDNGHGSMLVFPCRHINNRIVDGRYHAIQTSAIQPGH